MYGVWFGVRTYLVLASNTRHVVLSAEYPSVAAGVSVIVLAALALGYGVAYELVADSR